VGVNWTSLGPGVLAKQVLRGRQPIHRKVMATVAVVPQYFRRRCPANHRRRPGRAARIRIPIEDCGHKSGGRAPKRSMSLTHLQLFDVV
jgi:hypothetical protein